MVCAFPARNVYQRYGPGSAIGDRKRLCIPAERQVTGMFVGRNELRDDSGLQVDDAGMRSRVVGKRGKPVVGRNGNRGRPTCATRIDGAVDRCVCNRYRRDCVNVCKCDPNVADPVPGGAAECAFERHVGEFAHRRRIQNA